MSFVISGLPADDFTHLFGATDAELEKHGVIRKIANTKPGYPCRVTLEDAEPGEPVLLLNYESHQVKNPYRSAYAIYVREGQNAPKTYKDALPPVFIGRPIALRIFDKDGMLIGADLDVAGDLTAKIEKAFEDPKADYIHAHNAMHGCFAAEIRRG